MTSGSALPATSGRTAWWKAITRRVSEKEIRRQVLYDRSRKAVVRSYFESRARGALPPLLREYLEKLVGALLAFWIISALLSFLHARPWYTLSAFGLFYSLQATYYTSRLWRDPDFRIPSCKCAGAARDSSEKVLGSRLSLIPNVPNGALGVVLYLALPWLIHARQARAAALLVGVALAVSVYLAWLMIARIRAICTNCVNMAALNALILWQLLR